MTETATDTVLQRKAHAQRKARGGGAWSLPRALGRALSIAADALWGLAFLQTTRADHTMSADKALSRLDSDDLLVVLGHETGLCGLVAFSRDIVTGLIDVQTLGRVTQFPADARAYTATDAAMTAPLVDAALPRFASMVSTQPDMAHLKTYRFGALVEDVATAGLALEAETYRVTEFDVSLAQDMRKGRVVFLFPEPAKTDELSDDSHPGKHEAVLKLAPVRMQAVLARIHIPLDRAQALRPGDVVPLSSSVTTTASLVLAGGHTVARGKLGHMNGFRAIRIGDEAQTLHRPDPVVPTPAPEQPPEAAQTMPVPMGTDLQAFDLDGALELGGADGGTSLPVSPDPVTS